MKFGIPKMGLCGKMIYPDKKCAVTVANKRKAEDGVLLREYYCPECRGHHLSKSLTIKKYKRQYAR